MIRFISSTIGRHPTSLLAFFLIQVGVVGDYLSLVSLMVIASYLVLLKFNETFFSFLSLVHSRFFPFFGSCYQNGKI